ncbi:unnamed protein product [Rotaria magnacalcarata]|uniref:protein-tyrosine-phosphatase n=2 Tax=Rotaria magnacalcarata TaxID=392030 RepID=A0A819AYN3_9BILA|nr:unnamed protein product [Rotaria magnacalcarata]
MMNNTDGESITNRITRMIAEFEQSRDPESTEIGRQFIQLQRTTVANKDILSCYEGAKLINRIKNRYRDILPYDRYRVILPSDDDSDYINASFIQDLYGYPRYIAAQGPIDASLKDFFHMIWTFQITSIICTAIDNEAGRMKFRRYWPDDEETLQFGSYQITKDQSSNKAYSCNDYEMRPLIMICGEIQRRISFYHFLQWFDHDTPDDESTIFELLLRVYEDRDSSTNSPILVHCSAGCGRTGSMIAIDLCRLLLNDEQLFCSKEYQLYPVFKVATHIRQFRMALIQTPKQYAFVHKMFLFIMKIHGNILLRSILNNDEDETLDSPFDTKLSTSPSIPSVLRRQSGSFQITLRDPPIRRRFLDDSNTSSPAMSPSDMFSSISKSSSCITTSQTSKRSPVSTRFSLIITSEQDSIDVFIHPNERFNSTICDDMQLNNLPRDESTLLRHTRSDSTDFYSIALSRHYHQKQNSKDHEAYSD